MGLLGTTTAEQYYNSSQKFIATASQTVFGLTVDNPPASTDGFLVFVNGVEALTSTYSYSSPTITFNSGLTEDDVVIVEFVDRSLGDYRYITFENIISRSST